MATASVKSTAAAAAKWARRAGSAGTEYEQGVTGAGGKWAAAAAAGAQNWQQGVTAAAGRGAFQKGVTRAGGAKYERMARAKGPGRYSQGVAEGESDYATGVGPSLEVIGRTDLPPRGPTGSPSNYARVAAIGTALRKLKEGR